jgi:prephenate dehydrogenase
MAATDAEHREPAASTRTKLTATDELGPVGIIGAGRLGQALARTVRRAGRVAQGFSRVPRSRSGGQHPSTDRLEDQTRLAAAHPALAAAVP